jgi:hypothetical protein
MPDQTEATIDSLPEIVAARHEYPTLSEVVNTLTITTPEDRENAGELEHRIDQRVKEIKATFAPRVQAAHDAHKALTTWRSEELSPWEQLAKIVGRRLTEWDLAESAKIRKENERQARLAAEREAREAEKLARQAAELEDKGIDPEEFLPAPSAPIIPQVAQPQKTIAFAGGGKTTSRIVLKAEFIPGQEHMVPRELCSPDSKKLNALLAFNAEQAKHTPGVRVFEDVTRSHR